MIIGKGPILAFMLMGVIYKASGFGLNADTTAKANAAKALVNIYNSKENLESHLLNGTEYLTNDHNYVDIIGHQFFKSTTPVEGNIYYDGDLYEQVYLLYDIFKDQVIIEPSTTPRLQLIPEKIKYFTYNQQKFIRLEKSDLAASGLKTGFYELLYNNQLKVISKKTKSLQKETRLGGIIAKYSAKDYFYIWQKNNFYEVKNMKGLLLVFSDKKTVLRKYAKENKLNFKTNRQEAILKLTQYYTSL